MPDTTPTGTTAQAATPESTPEVTRAPVRIALEDVTPTIAAAFGDDLCLIWSGEWQSYWRAGGNGYTKDVAQAGLYTIQAAYVGTRHCDPSKQIMFERTPARGGDELREAARGVLERWDGASPNTMVELMDALRKALASTDMAGAGEAAAKDYGAVLDRWDAVIPLSFDDRAKLIAELASAAPPMEGLTSGEGWQLVPVEPTAAMLAAPWVELADQTSLRYAIWRSMLAASPKATATASVREKAKVTQAMVDAALDAEWATDAGGDVPAVGQSYSIRDAMEEFGANLSTPEIENAMHTALAAALNPPAGNEWEITYDREGAR